MTFDFFNFQSQLMIVIILSLNLNEQMQKMQKYQQLEKIGQGQFGIVRKIKRTDGKILVWKEIQYGSMSRDQKNQIVNEVNILKELKNDNDNDNIVQYYGHIIDKKNSKIYILMEYCTGGDLGSTIREMAKKKQYLDEEIIWKIIFQTVSALHHCHRKKILHRDLKPANIFIDSLRSNIKIGDFGLSKELGQHSQYAKTYVGTPYYMSPEQVNNKKYNQKSDIWSLGCIIYELSALSRPFVGNSILELGKNIEKGKFKPIPNRYSMNLQDLISKMLSVSPDLRPSTGDLLNLPFLAIRLEQKQIKNEQEKLRKRELQLNLQQQKYLKIIKTLEEEILQKAGKNSQSSSEKENQKECQYSSKLKKTKSIIDSNKSRIFKSMTISL